METVTDPEGSKELIMTHEGELMWTPTEAFAQSSRLANYMRWLGRHRDLQFNDYESLRRWSVDDLDSFWRSIWDYFEIISDTPPMRILDSRQMPGCRWFEGSRVNYAEHILRAARYGDPNRPAIHHTDERGKIETLSWGGLERQVLQLANKLRELGLAPGDRVVAYLPNIPETVVAALASIAVGAIWSSSAPEFGGKTVLDRFQQIEPKVMFVCDGYRFNGKDCKRDAEVREMVSQLPTLERVICVPVLQPDRTDAIVDLGQLWGSLCNGSPVSTADFKFERVVCDHPLWVLFSSGTTGLPKAIAQSHVGIVVEHYKLICLHMNLSPSSVVFFYSSTGWMVWNLVLSSLLGGGAIVLYDGSPFYPDETRMWKLCEDVGVTYFGSSASFINRVRDSGFVPKDNHQLSIDSTMIAGSPVGPELFEWFYENVAPDCWFSSQSGGTETCSCLVTSVPLQPVYAGEIQARGLGIDLHAWDDEGRDLINEVGELVITAPFPSMPLFFWRDKNNERYMDAYFDVFPGIWRHGDFIKINSRGGCFIYGRSDSTLNRHGVRIGTAEVYRIVEKLPEVEDSLVVCCELGSGVFYMPLFVVLKPGVVFTSEIEKKIAARLRDEGSPRHVPDEIYAVDSIPYTLTGKKMEVPVRKLLAGVPEDEAVSRDAMRDALAIRFFIDLADQLQEKNKKGASNQE